MDLECYRCFTKVRYNCKLQKKLTLHCLHLALVLLFFIFIFFLRATRKISSKVVNGVKIT